MKEKSVRGKRAKQLRKLAQGNSVGVPYVKYAYTEHPRMAPTKNKRAGMFYQILLWGGCTRAEYQRIKASYKASRRAGTQ